MTVQHQKVKICVMDIIYKYLKIGVVLICFTFLLWEHIFSKYIFAVFNKLKPFTSPFSRMKTANCFIWLTSLNNLICHIQSLQVLQFTRFLLLFPFRRYLLWWITWYQHYLPQRSDIGLPKKKKQPRHRNYALLNAFN